MKKLSNYLVTASVVVVMGIFTGCASKSATETTAVETTVLESIVANTTAKPSESSNELELISKDKGYGTPIVDVKKMTEDFVSLIGQADDKTVALLGEGIIAPEKDSAVSLREYNMQLFGEAVVNDVMYDEGKVTGFQISMDGTDMGAYEKQLTDALGKPELSKTGTNDESAVQSAIWKVSGANVELTKAYDVISLQIYMPQ